jgi:hypothetical protein
MVQEMANPTAALPGVVSEVIRPNYIALCGLVGSILRRSPEDETTRMCVHSIIGQIQHYVLARPVLAHIWPQLNLTPEQVGRIADHIVDFTLAGMDCLRLAKPSQRNVKTLGKKKTP